MDHCDHPQVRVDLRHSSAEEGRSRFGNLGGRLQRPANLSHPSGHLSAGGNNVRLVASRNGRFTYEATMKQFQSENDRQERGVWLENINKDISIQSRNLDSNSNILEENATRFAIRGTKVQTN
ncbi:hypothetical protein JTE90_021243 [Oedothorax gibbosus]|uniref:Uncharacterized protein n=1 Tax=Oedothorax gibbosus TaxID=931172 RepID=A0AAV6UWL5_9ARAC|nr:hypothetical protein JTE90_021243 [Oedothorax gibbosus]